MLCIYCSVVMAVGSKDDEDDTEKSDNKKNEENFSEITSLSNTNDVITDEDFVSKNDGNNKGVKFTYADENDLKEHRMLKKLDVEKHKIKKEKLASKRSQSFLNEQSGVQQGNYSSIELDWTQDENDKGHIIVTSIDKDAKASKDYNGYPGKGVLLKKWPQPCSNYADWLLEHTAANLDKDKLTVALDDASALYHEEQSGMQAAFRIHKETIRDDVLKEFSPYIIKHELYDVFSQQMGTNLAAYPTTVKHGRKDGNPTEITISQGARGCSWQESPNSNCQDQSNQSSQEYQITHPPTDAVDSTDYQSEQDCSQGSLQNEYQTDDHEYCYDTQEIPLNATPLEINNPCYLSQSWHCQEVVNHPQLETQSLHEEQAMITTGSCTELVIPLHSKLWYLLTNNASDWSSPCAPEINSQDSFNIDVHLQQSRSGKSLISLLPSQCQLVVRMMGMPTFIATVPKTAITSTNSDHRKSITSFFKHWQCFLTNKGVSAEIKTINHTPVVVANGSGLSVVLQELASQGLSIVGVDDDDPMTSFITHQREDFYLSIHPIENDHPAPPTLLSHVDPDPYNNCKTGAIIDFFPSHKDICGLSSYMKPTNNVDTNTNHCKVDCEAIQATSGTSSPVLGFLSPPAVSIEDENRFLVCHHPVTQHDQDEHQRAHLQFFSQSLEQISIEQTGRIHQRTVFVQEETNSVGVLLPTQITAPCCYKEHDILHTFSSPENVQYTRTPISDHDQNDHEITCKPVQETAVESVTGINRFECTVIYSNSICNYKSSEKFL
ncbi:uncharacterized protein [Dysidea avara]|uniref:uncharacterized protein isoform X3 n=1 Tax=Dysidea avara TaxID=196820 RepID=UPI00332540BB